MAKRVLKDHTERPIAIYNCNKQQVIGIFRTQRIVGKYLNPKLYMNKKGNGIANALNKKSRLEKSERFDFPVALRYITKEQEGLLPDGVGYIIFKDYPKPLPVQMSGFTDTRNSLFNAHNEVHHRIPSKDKNK